MALGERRKSPQETEQIGSRDYVYMADTGLCLEQRKEVGMFCWENEGE